MSEPVVEFLVQYGRAAYLNRFRNPAGLDMERGARVVVVSERGRELGEVLGPADVRYLSTDPAGDLLRSATPADERSAAECERRGFDLLSAAERLNADLGLPLTLLDAEVLLDGQALLHAVHWGECDATPLFERLSVESGLAVKLLDLTRRTAPEPAAAGGCGSGGCGSGGCGEGGCGTEKGGCSSGNCSRGAVKSAADLTAYFSDLRRQMEQAGLVRTPLV
jgi:hypothetical protein